MHASLPSSYMVQPTSSPSISSHDMTTVNAWINDIETIVTLDTAFCIDMMSQLTASKLGIEAHTESNSFI